MRMQLYKTCLLLLFAAASCSKSLLNDKPSSELIIPHTAAELWMLLDNENVMNRTPVLGIASGDDYYFTNAYYATRSALERNVYTWQKDLYEGTGGLYDWNIPYQQIFTCNIVLEALDKEGNTFSTTEYRALKATALFKRSWAMYQLSQLFAPAYNSNTANTDLGIPIKLSSDIQQPTTRATVQQTYTQMIQDIQQALTLNSLPQAPDTRRNRPCQAALYALLARIYLCMQLYPQAGNYADSSLQLHSTLIDYNTVSTGSTMPFRVDNAENLYTSKVPSTIYQCVQPSGQANIDTALYAQYTAYDLRKVIFFTNAATPRRKNFYDGTSSTLYTGLAVDEVYLIRAECLAQTHQPAAALQYLNRLLENRYTSGHFTPAAASGDTAVLQLIWAERRKELVMRGLRWTDLRRLAPHNPALAPVRVINGDTLRLPNSKAYTLPIPPDVIRLSGIPQN